MTTTTLSSREFNRDTGRAKKAAAEGPVFIAERGRPAHVLLSFAAYQSFIGLPRSIVDALSMQELSEIEVEFPESRTLPRAADLS